MSVLRLRVGIAGLALLSSVACGSTVPQQSTLSGPGAPVLEDDISDGPHDAGAGEGLEVPGAATEPGAAGAPGPTDRAGSSSGAADRPAPGEVPPPPAGSAPEVAAPAADRGPLRVGLLYVNNDAAAGAGVDNGNSFGQRRALEAQVKAVNARGGLGGRKVEPTYFELRSTSSSYAAELQAACSRFVDDAKVVVVMSYLGLTDDQFASCLGRAGVAHVNGSYGLGDTTSIASQPTTVSTQALSVDRRSKAALERLTEAGYLERSSRIGLLVEGCPYNERGVERTFLPTARRLGLDVVERQRTRCFGGLNDLGGLASDSQNAVLRFAAAGVDRVMIVSSVESNVLLVFTNAAESQGYRPGYALTSLALVNVLKDNIPAGQLRGAKGVGWIPSLDDTAPTLTPTPQARRCVADVRAQGVAPVSRADHFTVLAQCDTFVLTDLVLARSDGSAAPARFSAGLDAVGRALPGAVTLEGRTDFSGGRRDGPAAGRVFAWDDACSCFRYTGRTFPL